MNTVPGHCVQYGEQLRMQAVNATRAVPIRRWQSVIVLETANPNAGYSALARLLINALVRR